MNVSLAMSTWNDVVVTFWHQVYHQSESSYQDWRRSSMTDSERFAYEKRYLCGRKAPVPSTCDAVEALLRRELFSPLPVWLPAVKPELQGQAVRQHDTCSCVGRRCFPTKMLQGLVSWMSSMHEDAHLSRCQPSWLEDWMTKLVVADEVSAHIQPRRCHGSKLMNAGNPLETTDYDLHD